MKKIGILGGGQLGRMFIQNALNLPIQIHILDPDSECPCSKIADNFVIGDFKDYNTVINFAKDLDFISIEIEDVNTEALKTLKNKGIKVIPEPEIIEIFKDKGIQKKFYLDKNLPTADFYLINNKEELDLSKINFPFVQKLRTGGYDGKGVQIINNESELIKLWDFPSVIEKCAEINKELSVIFAKNESNNICIFPAFEMVFDNELNLIDYVICPAEINQNIQNELEKIIENFSKNINSSGIFAVEFFLNKDNSIWINETALRVHNSGHGTIEANHSSQYEIMLRTILNLPYNSLDLKYNSAVFNIIGKSNLQENPYNLDIKKILEIEDVYIHWYGKKQSKIGRKMGHITIISKDKNTLDIKIHEVKKHI